MWYERTKELTLRLVQSPSISETREELVFADILEALLREIPYWLSLIHI